MILVDANLLLYAKISDYPRHLAALAVEHSLTLCSTDGDFARFPHLQWQNPLS